MTSAARTPPAWLRGYAGAGVLGAYALVAWLSISGIESPDPALSGRLAPVLGSIAALACLAYAARYWPWLLQRCGGSVYRAAVALIVAGGVFYVASQWWGVRLNAIGGANKVYAGSVASKQSLSRRRLRGLPVLNIVERGSGRIVGFVVQPPLYAQAAVGDALRCEYREGWLGSPYRRKSAAQAPACALEDAPAAQ